METEIKVAKVAKIAKIAKILNKSKETLKPHQCINYMDLQTNKQIEHNGKLCFIYKNKSYGLEKENLENATGVEFKDGLEYFYTEFTEEDRRNI